VGDPAKATKVVVEFSREKAALVEARVWHPTQQVERRPNGGIRLSFLVANLEPLVSWILEWGPHARAVAPLDLVTQVKRELAEAWDQYR
jgi:predicted DNA-binding transcriptional regulator YafY